MSEPLKGVFWIIEGKILAIPYNKNFSLSRPPPLLRGGRERVLQTEEILFYGQYRFVNRRDTVL